MAAKRKSGQSQTRLIFAPMPGKSVATGSGLTNFTISDIGIERFSASKTGRWLAPGEAVSLHGFHLPGGMIYFGPKLTALNGYGTEPSLVNSKLEVANPQANYAGKIERFYAEYHSFDPVGRWKYLKWLSTGRNDPNADSSVVYLFLYGLERRIISDCAQSSRHLPQIDPPLVEPERQALRDELVRLYKCYPDSSFQRSTLALLTFLDLTTLLTDPEQAPRFNSAVIASLPRTGGEIPALLAVLLARIVLAKKPIPAEWAWAWFCQDAESNLRAAAVRCPDEMRRLFMARFPGAVGPKGLTLRLTKSPIYSSYYPVSSGYSRSVSALASAGIKDADLLRRVSRTGLKKVSEIAYACMDELDAYSRRIGRDPQVRNTLSSVALLPDPLFQEHEATKKFSAWLNTFVPAEPATAATVSAAELVSRWQTAGSASSQGTLSRSEAVTLVDAIDRLGFAMEPDLRAGGPAIAGPTAAPSARTLVAAVARRAPGSVADASILSASATLFAVGLPLLVRAARATGAADSPGLLPVALSLPHAAESDRANLAARLAYLVANPKEGAKLPKPKELSLEYVTTEERAQTADILASAASLSGAVSPAAVAELIRLFALLGLPNSEVFSRLHHSASAGSGRHYGAAPSSGDSLVTIKAGKPGAEHAIPKPLPKPIKKTTGGGGVAIDHALVRQKQAESAQISSLLADIFTDDDPAANDVLDTTAAQAAPVAGCLDARHAALLRALLAKESWTKAEFAVLAKAENLLPNAAIDTMNEAAFERFDEPVLDGDDPLYLSIDLAKELLS